MNDSSVTSRCSWAEGHPLNRDYHDTEWGVPVHDDSRLFEMLTLEGAQAGLSWLTILKKREGYRKAFLEFDPVRVASFVPKKVDELVGDASIVRHRGKIESTISNARCIIALWDRGLTLNGIAWETVGGTTIQNRWHTMSDIPSITIEARQLSKALKKLGFRFVGETTCYAFMQAAGLVNDHLVDCFRYSDCASS